MFWDIAEPVEAGGFEGGGGVEAASDGVRDQRRPLLLQQRQHSLLLQNQSINLSRLPVQVIRNELLHVQRRNRQLKISNVAFWQAVPSDPR